MLKIDPATLTPDFLKDCYDRVWKHYKRLAEKFSVDGERDYDALAKGQGQHLLKAITADLKKRFNKTTKKES